VQFIQRYPETPVAFPVALFRSRAARRPTSSTGAGQAFGGHKTLVVEVYRYMTRLQ